MDELKYEYILIRFGELTTKGKNKKDQFGEIWCG